MRMASLLEVSVSTLLGSEIEDENSEHLTEKLAQLNEQLAEIQREQIVQKRAGEKIGVGIVTSVLVAVNVISFSEYDERLFAMLLIACIMVFTGIVSPKLPFTRHTDLRLPWTVRDHDTWNVAHEVMGGISLPIACLYVGCSLTIADFEAVTLFAMLLWIGIPAVISYCFYMKK